MSDNVTYLTDPPRKRIGKSPVLKDGDAVRVPLFLMDGKARVADNVNHARGVKDEAYKVFVASLLDATARVTLTDMKVPASVDRHRAAESFRLIDAGDLVSGLSGLHAQIGSHRVASTLDSSPDRRAQHKAAVDFLEGVVAVVEATKVAK